MKKNSVPCSNPPLEAMVKTETPFGPVTIRKKYTCTSCGQHLMGKLQDHHLAQVNNKGMTGDFCMNALADRDGWVVRPVNRPGKKTFEYVLCPDCILRDIEGHEAGKLTG